MWPLGGLWKLHQCNLPIGLATYGHFHVICWSLDTNIKMGGTNTPFRVNVYDKRNDFTFWIVNFPHMGCNIYANPAYGVYISQLVRYARICMSKADFMSRLHGLSLRLRQQGFETDLLRKSFNKFFNWHGLIVMKYGATLREMRLAIQAWIAPSYPYITYLLFRLVFQLCMHYLLIYLTCVFSLLNNVLTLLCVVFLTHVCCLYLCSHCGWLLQKCSAVGIGFNGAETNCGIEQLQHRYIF